MIRSLPVTGLDAEYMADVGLLESLDIEAEGLLTISPDKDAEEDMQDSGQREDVRSAEADNPPEQLPFFLTGLIIWGGQTRCYFVLARPRGLSTRGFDSSYD